MNYDINDHLGDSSNDPGKDGGGEGGRTVVSFLDGIRKGSAGSQKSNKIQPVDTSLSNLAPAVSVVSSSSQQQQQQPGNGSRPTSASKIGKSKLSRVVPDAEVAGQTQQAEIFDLKMQHRRGLIDGPELKKSLEQLNTTSRTSLASTSNQNLVPDSEVKRKYKVAKLELQMMHRRGLISSAEMIQQLEELKKSPLSTSQESDVPIGSALISKLRSDQSRSVEKLIKSRAQLYASQKSLDMSDESLRQKFYDFRQELQIQHRRGVMSSEEMLQRLEQFKESLVPPAYLSATSSNRHSTAGRFANGDRRASIVIAHDQRRASFALVQPRDSSHTKSQMLLIQNREMAMSSRSRMDLSLANSEKGGSKASRVNMRVEHDQDGQKRIVFLKQSLNNMEDNSPAGASSYRLLPKNSTSNLSPDPANTVDSLGGRLMEMLRTKGSSYNIAEVERLQKAAPETENTFNAVTSAKNLIGFISPASKKADPRLRRESLAIKVDQSVFSVDEDNEDNLIAIRRAREAAAAAKDQSDSASESGDSKSQSSSQRNGGSKRLIETSTSKVLHMSTSIFALLLNAFILAGIVIFLHNYTAYLGKNPGIETYRVMVYKIMQYATYVTQTGFQTGVTLLFGFLMSTEKGFTLSGYGFLQTEHFSKLSFASNLSLQNKWRSFLQKLAVVFVVMDMLLVFTIFIATRLNSTDVSILNAIVPCIYFTQSGSTPYERYWPTFQVESGVGEFVFGSSLGYMRSEMAVNYTTAIFPPTIISSVNNGDSLQGPGFTVDIFSHCECAVTSDLSTFLRNGMDPWQVKSMIQKYRAFNNTPGIVFGVNSTINPSNQSDPATNFLTITNIFSGYAICGASGSDFPMMCTTNFTNHYNALVEAQFMTDGTSASIAVNKVQNLGFTTAANFTWLATAMTNILEGSISSFQIDKLNDKNNGAEQVKEVIKSAELEDDAAENASLLRGEGTGKASSVGSSSKTGGRARMIHETFGTKLNSMFWPIFATGLNIGILVFLIKVAQSQIIIGMDNGTVIRYFPVMLMVILELTNIITFNAIDKACSVLFGFLLSTKKGFSLTACGFTQTPALLKFKFASELPLQSKSQKLLRRLAVIWIVLFGVKGAFFYSATTVGAVQISPENAAEDCEWFTQVGYPVDRGWPTFQVESGVAEYVFGHSIGDLRSENPLAAVTTAIVPPNIISSLNNGDTILGPGYTTVINSTCDCADGLDFDSLVRAGIDASQVNQSLAYFNILQSQSQPGITWAVTNTSNVLTISNMIAAVNVCGGNGVNYPLVCVTNMGQHRQVSVSAQYMTDGTSASIALSSAIVVQDNGPADNMWMIKAMKYMLGTNDNNGNVNYNYLPSQTPDELSPLLWWATPNLIAIDRNLLNGGLETMYAILQRGACQRSYGTQGGSCPRTNTAANQLSMISLSREGLTVAYVCLGLQLLVSIGAMAVYIPWIISEAPISPAIRATEEIIYFVVLLSTSRIAQGLYEYSNAETFEIWQSLDVIVRIGEALNTVEQDIGQIVADKPKYVRPFTNSRRYT